MAGFSDLVPQAQPALFGGGVSWMVTEGRTWEIAFTDVLDTADDPINLASGVTGTCTLWDATSGAVVVSLDFTGASGSFTLSKDETDTVGLAADKQDGRRCRWGFHMATASDSVQVWGPSNSTVTIHRES
jgi:hypothetical protein